MSPTTSPWPGAVHELFLARARAAPLRPAVEDAAGVLTYGDLEAASGAVARRLRAAGLGRGDTVAVHAHRSAPLVTAILGVLRAGAAFLILDPAYPAARLAACLEDARPRAWIEIAAAGSAAQLVGRVVAHLDATCRLTLSPASRLAGTTPGGDAAPLSPSSPCTPDDVACVTFTSGSTGRPKGIVCRHGPLSAFLPWQQKQFGLAPEDRFSLLSGLSHDPLQRDLFTALCLGATVVVPEAGAGLAGWMARTAVTVAHLTPAVLEVLADRDGEAPTLGALRLVFVVGERLHHQQVAGLRRVAPAARCINLYGAGETQRAVAWYAVDGDPGTAPADGTLPLGRGVPGVELAVEDQRGRPVADGEVGEILLASEHLARGYLADPRLTAERFVPDPGPGRRGGRRYRTGDLGRRRADGALLYAGRIDGQMKIRGVRVEPGEVESALLAHPCIRQAAVVTRGHGVDARLLAFCAPVNGALPRSGDLRAHLRDRLPEAMIPNRVLRVDRLPLTPNGKVDRRALADLEEPPSAAGPPLEEPPTDGDVGPMLEIWRRLFTHGVHPEADFLELGGNSLLAGRLLAWLRASFGVELSVGTLWDHATPAALNAVVARRRAAAARPPHGARHAAAPTSGTPSGQAGDHPTYPLSQSQQALWFLERLQPGSRAYHLPTLLRLQGRLDAAALKGALTRLVERQEMLRSVLRERGGRPFFVLRPAPSVAPAVVDLEALPEARRQAAARQAVEGRASAPLDLARCPLLDTLLLRLGGDDHLLLLRIHHLASDGWSQRLLVDELLHLYDAESRGRPAKLPALPLQVRHLAHRQQTGEARRQADLDYWRQRLAGVSSFELPTDRPRREQSGRRADRVGFQLTAPASAALRDLWRRLRLTPFTGLLGVFQLALQQSTGAAEVVVGTDVANRDQVETEGLIGLFVNQLVLRTDLSGDPGVEEALERVRETVVGALAHPRLPFADLVREMRPPRRVGRNPLFQIMFVQQERPLEQRTAGGLVVRRTPFDLDATPFDLSVHAYLEGDRLDGTFLYDRSLFRRATLERLRDRFLLTAETAGRRPGLRLSELAATVAGALDATLAERREERLHHLDAVRSQRFARLGTGRRRLPAGR